MATIRSLIVRVGADVSQLQRQLQTAQQQISRAADNMSRIGSRLSTSVTLPLLAIGGSALKMAMDAVESENLFSVSMGNMAKSARDWSNQLSSALGLNAYEVRKNVSTFNVMFDSMKMGEKNSYEMSKGLTQLSYDMASFYNLKPEIAFQKLQAGISGETEPLKRLGIIVNETTAQTYSYTNGIAKQGEKLTEQQKVLARYGVIMEATKKAQGDMANTIDSPSNKLRQLQQQAQMTAIEFGTALIPVLQGFMNIVGGLVPHIQNMTQKFKDLNPNTQTSIILFATLAATIGPLFVILGQAVNGISALIGVMKLFISPAGLVIGAVAVLVGTLIYLYNTNETVKNAINDGWKWLSQTVPTYINSIKDKVNELDNKMLPGFLAGAQGLLKGAKAIGIPIPDHYLQPLDMEKELASYKKTKAEIQSQIASTFKSFDVSNMANGIANAFASMSKMPKIDIPDLSAAYKFNTADMLKGLDGMDQLENKTDKVKSAIEGVTEAVSNFAQKIKDQTQAVQGFVGVFDKYERKNISAQKLLRNMAKNRDTLIDFEGGINTLKNRGLSEDFVESLLKKGASARNEVLALAKASDAQLQEFNRIWEDQRWTSGNIANNQLSNEAVISRKNGTQIINLNITGNEIKNDYDVETIANKLISMLQGRGILVNAD